MTQREELVRRAIQYAQSNNLTLGEQLGFGVHGIVYALKSEPGAGQPAIKIYERETDYCRERDVYLRLREHEVKAICGCNVPQLLSFDDHLLVIEMSMVKKPFVLDFAGAFLDFGPDFSEEVMAEWRAEKVEQFGKRWPDVEAIIRELEEYGIHLVDVTPNNISFAD
ncbi:MAG: hypothetical protein L0Y72_02600 [Gemmataceae bacterium]|nr:hypothetical protein [Gemmataceae bacterium]MCI0737907.1 hypothetical protein [Gemmataceae bacterium]